MTTSSERRLNPHDRSGRNAEIVAERAAGESWTAVGERFGVSPRQARRIVRDLGAATSIQATRIDLLEIIERSLMRYEALVEHLAGIADEASDPMAAIRAINAQPRVTENEMTLLQNVGLLPSQLSDIGYEMEARTTALRAVELLDRHGAPVEARAELLSVLSPSAHSAAHSVPDRPGRSNRRDKGRVSVVPTDGHSQPAPMPRFATKKYVLSLDGR